MKYRDETPDEQWTREHRERLLPPDAIRVRREMAQQAMTSEQWMQQQREHIKRERARILKSKRNQAYYAKRKYSKRPFGCYKQCSKCKRYKHVITGYFHADKRNKDGLRSECKECRKKT